MPTVMCRGSSKVSTWRPQVTSMRPKPKISTSTRASRTNITSRVISTKSMELLDDMTTPPGGMVMSTLQPPGQAVNFTQAELQLPKVLPDSSMTVKSPMSSRMPGMMAEILSNPEGVMRNCMPPSMVWFMGTSLPSGMGARMSHPAESQLEPHEIMNTIPSAQRRALFRHMMTSNAEENSVNRAYAITIELNRGFCHCQ